jgi:hypothetical protein
MADWNSIKQDVENKGNMFTVTMETLRNVAGAGKLGIYVRQDISKTLAGMGLGHIPDPLPSYQHEQVRLYNRGTPIGDLIETVLAPGQQNDTKLSQQFGGTPVDHAAIIAQIRELVAE